MEYINPQTGKPWNCVESSYFTGRYIRVKIPCHPSADIKGYVMEHRLIMEGLIGRFLLPSEEVHHIDRNGRNNAPYNLKLLDGSKHRHLHGQEFARKAWRTVMRKRTQKRMPQMARKKKKTTIITTKKNK